MYPKIHLFLSLSLALTLIPLFFITTTTTARQQHRILAQNDTVPCPLNFTSLKNLVRESNVKPSNDVGTNCQYILEGLRLVLSMYLRSTGYFHPPLNASESCWVSYQSQVDAILPNFNIRQSCSLQTPWISLSCLNITSRPQFLSRIPASALDAAAASCNQSLSSSSSCASCLTSLTTLQASYLDSTSDAGGISDCTNLPLIYAGAFFTPFGPSDPGTARCLFSVNFAPSYTSAHSHRHRRLILALSLSLPLSILLIASISLYLYLKRRRERLMMKDMKRRRLTRVESTLPSLGGSTHLVKFSLDQIKSATKNFHRDNLIGRGGYGNVYKGILPCGTHIAIKRFKNCSAAGDAGFTHEVEVIASIRHVNLVELRGYCVATTALEGHQRMIVCDLMSNGSLHDHLFGFDGDKTKLTWAVRKKIALGMARGLCYLHYGAQPAIIHRDIKASNILLDEGFEAKVGDFGLAKFNPEGYSHLSTRVAGTMGYVAPEYALYGQLTERSDVYSFGVVLLELLSGKKAIMGMEEGSPSLVTDWAWGLVRKGHVMDVIEKGMEELGPEEEVEQFVLTAVLCSHPQLYARPTMDQVVKILESDLPVPCIPERPIPLVAQLEDIARSASSSGSGNLSTSGGFQSFNLANFDSSRRDEDGEPDNVGQSGR